MVTHGTATLEETAYLMDLTVATDKPIVITGAQRNFDEHDADGPRNLLYAVMVASSPEARGRGVLVALGGEIHAARDVTKVHTETLTCFAGRDGGPVGLVNKYGVTFLARPEHRIHLDCRSRRRERATRAHGPGCERPAPARLHTGARRGHRRGGDGGR